MNIADNGDASKPAVLVEAVGGSQSLTVHGMTTDNLF